MRFKREIPKPPPEIVMTFSEHEGWAVLAALTEWANDHPDAHDAETWRGWAKELDALLHRRPVPETQP